MIGFLSACLVLAPKPNIVIIFSDDHARQAISAYGSKLNKTPNIDALAKNGVIFDRFYTSNPICAPSRATLLTGKYSHQNGHVDNASKFNGDQMNFAKLLKSSGYKTAWIGKWHLESNPQGFDHWEILPGQGQYYNPDFITSEGTHRETGYATDLTTDKRLDFIDKNKGEPFCLVIGQKAPHRPWQPAIRHLSLYQGKKMPVPATLHATYSGLNSGAEKALMRVGPHLRENIDLLVDSPPARLNDEQKAAWTAAIKDEDAQFKADIAAGKDITEVHYQRYIKNYLRCIAAVDESVGRVTEKLKELKLDKNTIVIYASDQGFFLGENGWYDKRWFYEPSAGTPLIVSYPFGKSGKRRVSDVVQNVDLAPTILELAGAAASPEMAGKSLVPILKGDHRADSDQFAYGHFYESDDADHKVPKFVAITWSNYKLCFYYELGELEFFNINSDPDEQKNGALIGANKIVIRKMFDMMIAEQTRTSEAPEVIAKTKEMAARYR